MAEQLVPGPKLHRALGGHSGEAAGARLRWLGAAIVLAVAALFLSLLLLRQPTATAAAANGSYENDCCGTVVLRNGTMSFGTQKSVRYAVGEDELGPYLLPEAFVGTWEDRGFQIDGSRAPEKLRLDRIPSPRTVRLDDFGRSYSFERKSFRPKPAPPLPPSKKRS